MPSCSCHFIIAFICSLINIFNILILIEFVSIILCIDITQIHGYSHAGTCSSKKYYKCINLSLEINEPLRTDHLGHSFHPRPFIQSFPHNFSPLCTGSHEETISDLNYSNFNWPTLLPNHSFFLFHLPYQILTHAPLPLFLQ